jgi:transcriptional regulator with PAS, ATPase and Fis domain
MKSSSSAPAPATFYETDQGTSRVTNVSFDLTLEVIPEMLRDADSRLAHLVARLPHEVIGFEDIVGDSQAIRLAVGRAHRAALRGVSVLLLGESGTGKELFAQAIHRASPRREKPFVPINCAAVPAQLLESELFGHKKGAVAGTVSGADRDRAGAFLAADGGSLFLDEIDKCDLDLQAKLLRVLEPPDAAHPCTRRFHPVGSDRDSDADVRIIAATSRDLHAAIGQRHFREDLFYRLAAVTIHIPPLRDRRADIPRIAERLLVRINDQLRAEGTGTAQTPPADKSLFESAIGFVKRCDWPGNVRQLCSVLLQAAVMADGNSIDRDDLVAALGEVPELRRADDLRDRPLGDGFKLEEALDELHRHYLRRAMREAHGVKRHAAALLGIDRYQTLDRQLKRLKVDME